MSILWPHTFRSRALRTSVPLFILLTLGTATLLAENPPRPLSADQWVKRTLARLTLQEKIGQMLMVRLQGIYAHDGSSYMRQARRMVQEHKVGGFILFRSEVYETAVLTSKLQRLSKLPLLFAGDFEHGLAMRYQRAVTFPDNMAIGATRSEDFAYFQGKVTAREARSIGVHMAFAPVVDVNNNPDNPIINTRSYGEDPELVARLGAAFIRGAQQNGIIATAKHFPGHGDTSVDTHSDLAVIAVDIDRLRRVELVPFKAAIAAGVGAIMTAHVALPQIAEEPHLPATLSHNVLTKLLRHELGFKGLIVTDALEMMAIAKRYWPGEAAVKAVKAGADILLLPPDVDVVARSLLRAVKRGQIPVARINESVERILRAKAQLGLHLNRHVKIDQIDKVFGDESNQARALQMAEMAITAVKNDDLVLPLNAAQSKRILSVVVTDERNQDVGSTFQRELRQRSESVGTETVDAATTEDEKGRILARAQGCELIVCALFVRWRDQKGTVALPESQAAFVRRLFWTGKPVLVVAFGSPYLLRQLPEARNYVCAYSQQEIAQQAAARAIFGEIDVKGKLPVSLQPEFRAGYGLEIPKLDMTLKVASAEAAGFSSSKLEDVFKILESGVRDHAFPAAVIAIGRRGHLVAQRAFGTLDYSPESAQATVDTIFDLASLTKVVGATTAAMILYEAGKLDLERPVAAYIPEFAQQGKEKVLVKHLLTHSSGLPAYERMFLELSGKEAILDRICGMRLEYEPGTKSVYSDLGMIVMGEIIERASGQSLDEFLRQKVFDPLGMKDTFYNPSARLKPRIAPTENDPWRRRIVWGEVHDENAYAMGGVSAHAGLFSTAHDLAIFCQMMLNGGVYDHRRIVKRSTIELFTRRQDWIPQSTRALGWDTPSPGGSGGSLLSPRAYGHTGFTGTSIWIDPERELFVVLLTNRVHPTRENNKIMHIRSQVHDAVIRALQ